jgi:peroxiredoxin
LPDIERAGASLIAISPMLRKYTPQLVKKLGLNFPVLSDPGSKVLETFGILFTLPPAMVEIYKGFDTDLERFNGESSWQLPLPCRMIVNQEGLVKNIELSTDHNERPEPTDTVKLLQALSIDIDGHQE